MKIFSIFSVIISTLLIGYFFIVGLPKIASISKATEKPSVFTVEQGEAQLKKRTELILRDKCNSYVIENKFNTSAEAENYLDNCMTGQETSSINVIRSVSKDLASTSVKTEGDTLPRLSQDELTEKCNNFMTRARFDSQKSADLFLKNCLAGK